MPIRRGVGERQRIKDRDAARSSVIGQPDRFPAFPKLLQKSHIRRRLLRLRKDHFPLVLIQDTHKDGLRLRDTPYLLIDTVRKHLCLVQKRKLLGMPCRFRKRLIN